MVDPNILPTNGWRKSWVEHFSTANLEKSTSRSWFFPWFIYQPGICDQKFALKNPGDGQVVEKPGLFQLDLLVKTLQQSCSRNWDAAQQVSFPANKKTRFQCRENYQHLALQWIHWFRCCSHFLSEKETNKLQAAMLNLFCNSSRYRLKKEAGDSTDQISKEMFKTIQNDGGVNPGKLMSNQHLSSHIGSRQKFMDSCTDFYWISTGFILLKDF